jgi:hypothetical protein
MKSLFRLAVSLILLVAPAAAPGAPGDWSERTFEARGPGTVPIVELDSPPVTADRYAITGTVAYDGVEGEGYLEMWSQFPDGSRYFSRTLGTEGLLEKLHGTSPERPFALPFFLKPDSPRPVRLEVNVVLPAGGRVTVRGLRFGSGADALRTPGAWWSGEEAGAVGGAAGGTVGVLGALVGILSSLGRGRRVVLAALLSMGIGGAAVLAAGGVALALGQPYEVWYPLVLLGVLGTALGFALLPTARRRFEALELRRIQALDARG